MFGTKFLASSDEEKTDTGRPLRRAAKQVKEKIKESTILVEDEEEEEALDKETKKDKRPVGALTRTKRAVL